MCCVLDQCFGVVYVVQLFDDGVGYVYYSVKVLGGGFEFQNGVIFIVVFGYVEIVVIDLQFEDQCWVWFMFGDGQCIV